MDTRHFQIWKIAILCNVFILLFNSVSPCFASVISENSQALEELPLESSTLDQRMAADIQTFRQTIGSEVIPQASALDYGEFLEKQAQAEVEVEFPKLEMKASPRLLLPGVPVQVNWNLTGMAQYETKSYLSVHFDISKDLILSEKIESATQVDSKMEEITRYAMAFDPKKTQGILTFSYDEKAADALEGSTLPWQVTVSLMDGDKLITTNTVLLDRGHYKVPVESGARITTPDGRLTVEIPGKAISEDLVMEIREPEPAANPSYNMSGFPLEILAVGTKSRQDVTQFTEDLAVTFHYDEERIYGWPEADLQIFYYDEVTHDWLPVETVVDTESNTLTAHVNHLTVFDYAAASWQGYHLPTLDATQVSGYIGAGSYSVNLWTPPGPGGMQPTLSLSYNSQVIDDSTAFNQASWVGMGWSMDTGFVERDMHGTNDDLTDDTYRLNINGVSSLLLPIAVDGEITTYATEDQNYMQIFRKAPTGDTKDDSTWTVYDKEGNIYLFDTRAKTHTTTSCVTSADNLNLTWRWSLHTVTNRFGQVITYTYTPKQKTETDNCQNVVAVYPWYITYPNNQYRVEFVLQNRTDYQSSWTGDTAKRLFQRQRLDKIYIQKATGPSTWENIRTYDFSYSTGTTNQIYPNFVWTAGGRTTTLASIQEKNGGETVNLPATSFTYTDKMHLTKVDNGQGGSVTLSYEPWYVLDDYNDALRSLYTPFGTVGYECSSGVALQWSLYGTQGTVKCEQSMLQIDGRGGVAIGVRAFPAHILKPGGRYWMFVNARAISGITDMLYGFIDAANGDDVELSLEDIGTSLTDYQGPLNMAATYDPVDAQLLIECNDCYIKKLQYMLMPGWYRVTTRVVTDAITEQTATYTYQYDDTAVNNHDNSIWVPSSVNGDISKLYTSPMREYRGNAMTRVINPDDLVTTTWYYQNDTLKGRAYRTLVSSNDYYQPFNLLATVQNTWTLSVPGTQNFVTEIKYGGVVLKTVNTSANWNATARRNGDDLTQGNVVYLKFRLDSDKPSTQAELGVENTAGDFFGVVATPSGSDHVLKLRTRTGGGSETDGDTLLTIPAADRNEWYWLMLSLDSGNFSVQAWQEDDPQNVWGTASVARNGAASWHYIQKVNNGILYVDAYHEGLPFSMTASDYSSTVLYDTVVGGDYPDVASSNLVTKFDDLQVVWNYLSEQTVWNYEGDASFTSTQTSYEYNTDDQGGSYASTQFGNPTRVTQSAWNGSAYVPYRATRTQYWPTIPTIASNLISGLYLSLPARQITLDCTSGGCDFSSETGIQFETLYLYDTSQIYNVAPSSGILTGQRVWVDGDDYSQVSYTYDSYGNISSQTAYTGYGTVSSSPAGGAQTTTTVYDSVYHTYATSTTNALGQITEMTYDYSIGQPVSVIDPNDAETTAAYDAFGRQTKIVAPGDTTTNPTLLIEYVNYVSSSAPFHINLTQRVNETASIRLSHFYNGLGQEIQTQQVGSVVNGSQATTVTDVQYDELGRAVKQTVPYTITYAASPAFVTQTFSQAFSQTTYDLLGRVLTSTPPNGNDIAYAYDDLTVSVTDALNNTTVTTADIWGRTMLVEAPEGPDLTYTWDVQDRLLSTTKGSGTSATTVSIEYNQAGQKTEMDDPDLGAWSYTYDGVGSLATQTDARGCVTTLTYDALNRLTGKNYAGGVCDYYTAYFAEYTYDDTTDDNKGIGRRTGMSYYSGEKAWVYDERGRMTRETVSIDAENYVTQYSYNSADLLTSQTVPGGEVLNYTYNSAGQLIWVKNSYGAVYLDDARYDEAGRLTRLDYGWASGDDVLRKTFSYYSWTTSGMGGLLSSMAAVKTVGSVSVQNLAYTYDNNANITQIVNSVAGETAAYSYDDLNRLTEAGVNDGQTDVYTEVFEYDPDTGQMSAKGPDTQNLTTYVYGASGHANAISEFGDNDYYYDEDGNQTHRYLNNGEWYYRLYYDQDNRLYFYEIVDQPQERGAAAEAPTETSTPTETATATETVTESITETPTETAAAETIEVSTELPTEIPSETPTPTATVTDVPAEEATEEAAEAHEVTEEATEAIIEAATEEATEVPEATQEPTATGTPTDTATPETVPTATDTPEPSVTPTDTAIPELTSQPVATDLPPEPELTAELLAHLTERPETGEMRLAMLEDVYEVSYYYDADGNMTESVVRAQTGDLINIQWTIYINRYYERQIDYVIDTTTSQVVEVDYYYRKYYYAGNTRIAMRYYEDGVPTQYWLLSDQVNSQSVTLNEEGTLHSEVRYTPFGETRYTSQTDTPTDYLYTGQRLEEELGLYFYNARFYDASLIHFNQPDTIIPGMENPISWHRYAYVNFNPLKYIDPSGHYLTEQDSLFDGSSYQSGARTRHNPKPIALFVGPWTEKGIQAVTAETNLLAIAYADAYNTEMRLLQRIGEGELQFTPLTPRAAFLRIHHGAITYTRETYSCPTGCAAMTRSLNAISVFSNVSDSYLERSHRVISHENFHAFNNATSSIAQTIFQGIYSDLLRPMIDGVIQHTDDNRGGWFGYAGGAEYWQFGYDGNQGSEEFADSGIGWLYDTWGEGDQGNLRKNRMEGQMTYFLFSLLWNGR